MQTVTPSQTCRHTTIRIDTEHPTQFIDLTSDLEGFVAASAIQSGLLNVQSLHTTAAIVVNEHDPLLLTDMAGLLERLAPRGCRLPSRQYHACARPIACSASHLMATPIAGRCCLAPTAALNVVDGRLQLGRWQRVFLVELDGPRAREVSVLLLGERRGEGQADSAGADRSDEPVVPADQVLAVPAARPGHAGRRIWPG